VTLIDPESSMIASMFGTGVQAAAAELARFAVTPDGTAKAVIAPTATSAIISGGFTC
jgi:hypothetical protein